MRNNWRFTIWEPSCASTGKPESLCRQLAGGVICLVLAVVSDVPDAIVAYLTPLVVLFFAIDGLWRMRILHVAILFVMITGMEEMTEILRTYYLELPGNGPRDDGAGRHGAGALPSGHLSCPQETWR